MSLLEWSESLSAPRSLGTSPDVAVAVVEDPGVIELRAHPTDAATRRRFGRIFGAGLPTAPWRSVRNGDAIAIWTGPDRWRIMLPREQVIPLLVRLSSGKSGSVTDLTGAFCVFRVVGPAAREVLCRLCALDLAAIAPETARGTSVAGVTTILFRDAGATENWVLVAPRSFGPYLAQSLVQAARHAGGLGLFQPQPVPPV